jgi:hypothetical protein
MHVASEEVQTVLSDLAMETSANTYLLRPTEGNTAPPVATLMHVDSTDGSAGHENSDGEKSAAKKRLQSLSKNHDSNEATEFLDTKENTNVQVGFWLRRRRRRRTPTPRPTRTPTPAPTYLSKNTAPTLHNNWKGYGGEWGSPTVTIKSGLCLVGGLIKGGTWGHIATLPSQCRPDKRLIFNLNNHQYTSRVDVQTNGRVDWVTGGRSHGWISLSGITFPLYSDGRSTLTLSNGWQAYGHSYGSPSVNVKKDGICLVNGLVRSGSWGHIATLPSNCRPSKRLIFNLNNHAKTARVDVETSGRVSWAGGGKDHAWISLTGIAFPTGNAGQASLTLTNGWQAYGHSYGSPTVTVRSGICFVEGLIKHGGWGHLATLPANCRPSNRLMFNLNNHQYTSRVDVHHTGLLTWHAGGKSHSWISLTGITFAPAAVTPAPTRHPTRNPTRYPTSSDSPPYTVSNVCTNSNSNDMEGLGYCLWNGEMSRTSCLLLCTHRFRD